MTPSDSGESYDVIIVGAGPAGLSAALLLGRCRLRVLVLDDGQPRNRASRAAHGFFTRDGASPELLRRIGVEQLAAYEVTLEKHHVSAAEKTQQGFAVRADSKVWTGRKLLLATGLRESAPRIPGISENWGSGVFCCPYCDGWEVRDLQLGGLITGSGVADYGCALLTWSRRVTLFTNGPAQLSELDRAQLARNGVELIETQIERVIGPDGDARRLRGLKLCDGPFIALDALFVHAGQHQHSELARALGCELANDVMVKTHGHQHTNVPGLYVAGDAAGHVESIAIAVAEGYQAALGIQAELRRERTV